MKKTMLFTIMVILGCLSNLQAQQSPSHSEIKTALDNYFKANIDNGFSGSVLVAKNEEIILSKGYGYANVSAGVPNTPNTIFDIGSNTKQITAAAILKLVELQKLKLTDPLNLFFKNIPKAKENITIHQLLTHSSGLQTYSGNDFDMISKLDFLKEVFAYKLLSTPGSSYHYSNVGYSVLAIILEQVSGQDYEAFLNQYLFQPVGMDDTGYLLPKWDNDRIAHGYRRGYQDIGTTIQRYKDIGLSWHLKGNGGLNSTIKDLYKWYQALKNNTLISEASKQQLFAPHILESKTYNSFYGYGWSTSETPRKTKMVAHSGANPGFYSDILYFVEEDVFVMYCANSRVPELEYLAWEFQKLIFDLNDSPKPVAKNKYIHIYNFIKANTPDKVSQLQANYKKAYGTEIKDVNLLNRLGYYSLGTDLESWVIPLLQLNLTLFPEDGNLWDTLGEAYYELSQPKKAIEAFKKALVLKPETECGWCGNSQEKLNTLLKN